MQNPLHIPKSKRTKGLGLTVYCKMCATNVSDFCKKSGKSLQKCEYGDRHHFKIYCHVPGTGNARKTKVLQTRDVNEAIAEAVRFHREVKEGIGHKEPTTVPARLPEPEAKPTKETAETPQLLVHALAKYVSWLHDDGGVPAHQKKELSENYKQNIEKSLQLLARCIEENGYDLSSFKVSDINDTVVGLVYEQLLDKKKFANRTFNKYMSFYGSFLEWYSDTAEIPVRNGFKKVKKKKLNPNPQSISEAEFEALLAKIATSPENGVQRYIYKGEECVRNLYRPWLAHVFRLGAESGRRAEEICNFSFDKIIHENGKPVLIRVEDYKVNHITHRKAESEKKYVYVPVTQGLYQVLLELGYEQYKDTNRFFFANEFTGDRGKYLVRFLSRSFSHYYDQIGTRNLTFKSLRKTYITQMKVHFSGKDIHGVTQHSGENIITDSYIDKEILAKAARNFTLFSKETGRTKELKELRTTQENHKEINQGVEK